MITNKNTYFQKISYKNVIMLFLPEVFHIAMLSFGDNTSHIIAMISSGDNISHVSMLSSGDNIKSHSNAIFGR